MGFQLTEEQAKEVSEYKSSFNETQKRVKERERQKKINACEFFNRVKPEFIVEFEKQIQTLGFADGIGILANLFEKEVPMLSGFVKSDHGFIHLDYSRIDRAIKDKIVSEDEINNAITEYYNIGHLAESVNAMTEFCGQNGYKQDYRFHERVFVKKQQNDNISTLTTNKDDFEENKWAKWIFLGFLIFAAIILFVFSSC